MIVCKDLVQFTRHLLLFRHDFAGSNMKTILHIRMYDTFTMWLHMSTTLTCTVSACYIWFLWLTIFNLYSNLKKKKFLILLTCCCLPSLRQHIVVSGYLPPNGTEGWHKWGWWICSESAREQDCHGNHCIIWRNETNSRIVKVPHNYSFILSCCNGRNTIL